MVAAQVLVADPLLLGRRPLVDELQRLKPCAQRVVVVEPVGPRGVEERPAADHAVQLVGGLAGPARHEVGRVLHDAPGERLRAGEVLGEERAVGHRHAELGLELLPADQRQRGNPVEPQRPAAGAGGDHVLEREHDPLGLAERVLLDDPTTPVDPQHARLAAVDPLQRHAFDLHDEAADVGMHEDQVRPRHVDPRRQRLGVDAGVGLVAEGGQREGDHRRLLRVVDMFEVDRPSLCPLCGGGQSFAPLLVRRQHDRRRLRGLVSLPKRGHVPERSNGADCKSVIRRFESDRALHDDRPDRRRSFASPQS